MVKGCCDGREDRSWEKSLRESQKNRAKVVNPYELRLKAVKLQLEDGINCCPGPELSANSFYASGRRSPIKETNEKCLISLTMLPLATMACNAKPSLLRPARGLLLGKLLPVAPCRKIYGGGPPFNRAAQFVRLEAGGPPSLCIFL